MSDRRMQSSRDDRRRDRDGPDRRRRSRSPRGGGGAGGGAGGGGRREYGDVDSYSSSRNYREREREDRYQGAGREERPRDWDRGTARRDARRDDGDRRRDTRRDRDLFDDRRGPRRDDRRDRGDARGEARENPTDRARDNDDMRQMERQSRVKSASPPPRKPKEPTPDLTDVPSVLVRKRRLNQWDIKPPGYENVTAEQAKLSGMFPLPGAPRQQPMDPSKLQAFMNQPGNQASTNALKPSTARQSKRLFVHRLPATATDDSVAEFFNLQLNGLNVTKGVDPCISAQVNQAQGYALLEFKNPEDATNAMALDGMSMEYNGMDTSSNGDSNGASNGLEIRRPKDYIVPTITDDTQHEAGVLSTSVPDTQNKIGITNIPVYLEDEQMQELLQSFGELKSFVLVRDTSSGQSRGIAYCEYMEPGVTDAAVEALNGMELGETKLKVKRASIGIQQVSGEMSVNAMSLMAGTQAKSDAESGRVLCLMNMITPEELMDTEESEGKSKLLKRVPPHHILIRLQKSSTTSRKSAPSMAKSSTLRCLVLPVADRALVLARSTSSTKSLLRRRRLWLRWPVGSLRTARLWSRSLARSTLTSVPGRCLRWLGRKKSRWIRISVAFVWEKHNRESCSHNICGQPFASNRLYHSRATPERLNHMCLHRNLRVR
jgi:splicing factor U2AF subunit